MKKSNFAALILGTIGGLLFSIGMCMALLTEWGLFRQGILAGAAGLVILLAAVIVWRRMEGKEPVKLNPKTIVSILIGIAGALLLGGGMCLCMVYGNMIPGIVVGCVGIAVLIMLIPVTKGIR